MILLIAQDVVHIGLTDFPSRLPTQSSTLYANNISKFLLSIGEKDHYNINLDDEVVRGSIVLHNGEKLWPAPAIPVSAAPAPGAAPAVCVQRPPLFYFNCIQLTYTIFSGLLKADYRKIQNLPPLTTFLVVSIMSKLIFNCHHFFICHFSLILDTNVAYISPQWVKSTLFLS